MEDGSVLNFVRVTKRFGEVVANNAITFSVAKGEVHALVGENGAGKTTLMNILFGIYQADEGRILWRGEELRLSGPHSAVKRGIGMVQQDLCLAGNLSVAQNIIAGAERAGWLGRIPWPEIEKQLSGLLGEFRCRFPSTALAKDLSTVQKRTVEILRLLWHRAQLIILDEPTSGLGPEEIASLFEVIYRIKKRGVTVLFITHRLREVFEIADRVSVLRRGKLITTSSMDQIGMDELKSLMFGEEAFFSEESKLEQPRRGPVLAEIHFNGPGQKNCSFKIHEGERIGIAALPGNGGEELGAAFSGSAEWRRSLKLKVKNGENWQELSSIKAQRQWGIRIVPQERLGTSLASSFSIAENSGIGWLASFYRRFIGVPLISYKRLTNVALSLSSKFGIKMKDPHQRLRELSGGNQQRFQIGRELSANGRVMIMEHPTQGIDVTGVADFRSWLSSYLGDSDHNLQALVVISPDLEELIKLCNRLLVMYRGQIVYETAVEDIGKEQWDEIGHMLTGGTSHQIERRSIDVTES